MFRSAKLAALVALATPILFSNLAMFGMSMTMLMVAGHLGAAQLTAVAYAQMIFDVTILVFASGFVVGQATLSAQAFGARNFVLIGRYCQMNCLCVTLACIPIGVLWWHCGELLRAVGISAETAALAAEYAHYSTPWLWPRLIFQVLSVYFKSMQNVLPAAVFAVVFTIFNACLSVALAHGVPALGFRGYGLAGAAISMSITHYARTLAYLVYMFHRRRLHATSWTWDFAFTNVRLYFMPMVKVGGPMIVGQLVENLQLQTMSIFAAMTSEVALGANNSMMELIFFLTSPIYGMIDGGATRMGMHLGAGNAAAAKATSHLVFYGIFGLSLAIVVPWFAARSAVGHLFSSDAAVIDTMTSISTLAAAGYIIMSLFYYSMATLQAQARTVPIMSSFLIGAWLVGVPGAYVFGFPVELGLLGIWIGMATGYLVTTVLGVYFTCTSNWEKEAKKAAARSKARGGDDTEFVVIEMEAKSTQTRLPMLVIDECTKGMTSTPILFSNLAMFGMSMTVLVVAGHLGPAQLTAVAYSEMIFDITVLVLASGFIATLSAQAFGARNLVLIGRYCQMNCLCVTLACIPISALWWFCGDILAKFGVSHETVAFAETYAHYSAPWLWPRLMFQVLSVYFKSMQNVMPAAVCAITFAILNVGLVVALADGVPTFGFKGLGLVGAPVALTLTHYARLTAYVVYMFGVRRHHAVSWTWDRAFLDRTQYLLPMVRVGGPMVVGQLVENLQLQTMSIFAGMTSEVALGANNSMLELILFLTSPIYGLIDAGATRIAMHLGAGKPRAAKATSRLVFYGIFGTCVCIVIPWLCARKVIGKLFSSDAAIIDSLTSINTLAAAGYIVMSFFYYSMATLQAQARTVPIMISFLVGAWLVGVPMAYLFAFPLHHALYGVWLGMSLGYLITTFFGVYFTAKSNWSNEAKKAIARSKSKGCDEAEPFMDCEQTKVMSTTFSTKAEAGALARLATPILFSNLALFGMSMTVMIVAGHLGAEELTAVAYAQMIFDITLVVFASGFISGQASLSAQAFGAKNLVLVGRYCQMACFCVSIACIPIGALWWFCGDLLRLGNISAQTIAFAAEYAHYSMPWLWPRLVFQVLSVYFKSMQNVLPAAVFAIVFTAFNAGLCVILVFGAPSLGVPAYGLIGAPMAMTIAHYSRLITYVVYMFAVRKHHASSWQWNWLFLDLREYLRPMIAVGGPLAVGILVENLQLQTMSIFAASTSEVDLGAHNSMLQLIFFLTSPIFGLTDGGSTRIAMHLGAGDAASAKATSRLVFLGIFGFTVLIIIPWFIARASVGKLFSTDEDVIATIKSISTLAAAGYIIMSLFYYAMATLQAQARTLPIMTAFLVGAWAIGVPLAYVLAFPADLELFGIWIGMSVGYVATTALGVYFVRKSDWPEEAKKAVVRSKGVVRALARIATPILFSNLAMFGMSLTVLVAAGHLGPGQLTAVAYSQMIFDITILVFSSGFVVGQASLSAQAFGAKNLGLIGRYCQMNCLCVTLACIPIGMLWWFCGDILHAAGISDSTIVHATQYAHYSMPWLWPRLIFQVVTVYFKSMQNVLPAAVFAVIFTIINAGLVVVLVFGIPSAGFEGYGLVGAPISMTITHYCRTVTYIAYMFWYRGYHASSWSWDFGFTNVQVYLKPMVKVGGPMMIGQLVENLQLQAMSVFAAMSSEVDLGANNSMLELIFFLTSPIYGMIDGGSARIGMYLGAGKPIAAKATSHLVFYGIFGLSVCIVVPWLCARESVGKIFSTDALVVDTMGSISTLAAAGYIIMSCFYYAMTTLQAQARTLPIMVSFFIGAWVIGVPGAYVFGFPVGLGLLGIWVGMSVGYLVTTILGVYFTYKSDWAEEAKKAVERSKGRDNDDHLAVELELLANRLTSNAGNQLEEGYVPMNDSKGSV
ncbi:Multidrug/Oligosaccharidyl-lipid/Polysaccharide (MOP) Flippase Superfamily [Achlya hypogyna]|uniref:Multidrug/Oligosaccharidyl-lipid/Polysaccharide (MOP) Flippase Superfamily n=1 Tax=Achlya hypogyna TaxID=1202772 RepID=A0A1V9YQE3_ACHHY|nr:Multidrug/Oligosaccharidyl-lipid/Polysaccharide (MOP) Flippase Superfamily [Achlya hypogyna]